MAILRIKLVESLSKDRYLREDKIDISRLPDPEQGEILDIIRDSNDIEAINQVADNLKVSDDLKAPIVRSIIKYRSIDEKVNPIIQIYNNFDGNPGKITEDQLFTFYNVLNKVPMTHSNISKYFNPDTDILKNKDDLNYLATLVAHLSNPSTARKYKNSNDDTPTIDKDLMDNGKFKEIKVIKRLMDTFTTDNDASVIYLKNWFKREKQDNHKEFIITGIKAYQSELNKEVQENLDEFTDYLDSLFLDGNQKAYDAMLSGVEVPESLTTDNSDNLKNSKIQIINRIYEYAQGQKSQSRSGSVSDILDKEGYTTVSEKFDGLKKSIDNMNIDKAEKLSAKAKLDLLAYSKNKNLTDTLFDAQVPDSDINKLPKVIFAFLKQAVKQNYLYTTIREALALKGKQPAEGKQILPSYIQRMSNRDVIPNYLDRFNKVWNNKNLQNQLLNARITRTASGAFNWVKAITDFLDNIRI